MTGYPPWSHTATFGPDPDDGGDSNSQSSTTSSPPSSQSSGYVFELIILESTDASGNTIIEISDSIITSSTSTTTVSAGNSLPTATSTSDPYHILGPAATPAGPLSSSNTGSPSTSSQSSPTEYGISNSPPPTAASQAGDQEKSHSGPLPIGALVVVPLAIIAICIVAVVLWRRRRAAAKRGVRSEEMKMRSPEEGLSRGPPGYSESTGGLLMTTATPTTPLAVTRSINPLAPAASRSNRASQPVILGTSMDGAYFTGLDTSDAVSMASGAPHSDASERSYDTNSITSDEPPPPYRPRSVPSISRETSLRHPGQGLSVNTTLAPLSEGDLGLHRRDDDDDATPTAETTPMRNPFDDPEEDAVSQLSTPMQSPRWRGQGNEDARSMISEFSFEHEHR